MRLESTTTTAHGPADQLLDDSAAAPGTSAEKASTAAGSGRWARLTERFPILKKKRGVALLCAVPLVLLSGLAGLAALPGKSSGGGGSPGGDAVMRDDVEFYGRSPAVYPSRKSLANHRFRLAKTS